MTRSTRPLFQYRHALVGLLALVGACASDDSDTRTGAANASLAPALTECASDAECVAVSSSMCPVCGGNEAEWLFVRVDALGSVPATKAQSCDPCASATPAAYCADDGHCAAFEERANGKVSSACFSPRQAVDHAYLDGAVGCDCAASEPDVCVTASDNRNVALVCTTRDGKSRWQAVLDGPCGGIVID